MDVFRLDEMNAGVAFSTVDQAVEKFVELRDKLRDHQRSAKVIEDDLKFRMDQISMWLRDRAEELGVESFKTKSGTAYKSLKESYRVNNWDDFIAFVKENDCFHLLEKRVAKNAAREVHKESGEVPVGLEYSSEIEFNVLRPRGSKKEV